MLSINRKLDLSESNARKAFAHSVLVHPAPRSVMGGDGYLVGDSEGSIPQRNLVSALFAADGMREANRDEKGRKASVIYSRDGKAPYYLLDGKPSDVEIVEAIESGDL